MPKGACYLEIHKIRFKIMLSPFMHHDTKPKFLGSRYKKIPTIDQQHQQYQNFQYGLR